MSRSRRHGNILWAGIAIGALVMFVVLVMSVALAMIHLRRARNGRRQATGGWLLNDVERG